MAGLLLFFSGDQSTSRLTEQSGQRFVKAGREQRLDDRTIGGIPRSLLRCCRKRGDVDLTRRTADGLIVLRDFEWTRIIAHRCRRSLDQLETRAVVDPNGS